MAISTSTALTRSPDAGRSVRFGPKFPCLLVGDKSAPPSAGPRPLYEPPSDSELRVLRYLPTHLTASEIADQLYVSVNTVKTHIHHLYAKLGVHRRHQAVERARALGLLAPSPRGP